MKAVHKPSCSNQDSVSGKKLQEWIGWLVTPLLEKQKIGKKN